MDERLGRIVQIGRLKAGKAGLLLVLVYLALWIAPFPALFASFFSVDAFLSSVSSHRVMAILLSTCVQALLSTAVSFLIAIVPAYYAGKRNDALSHLLNSTIFIPFFFPAVSAIIAFSLIFSPHGILAACGFDCGVMYTLKGVIIAHSFYNSPLFVRYISAAMKRIPAAIREESSLAGASPLMQFLKIEWPLIAPSAGRAALLVFMYSFMSFVIVMSIGGVGFYTIEAEVSSVMRSTLDFPYALSLSIIQFLIIGLVSCAVGNFTSYELPGSLSPDTRKARFSRVFSVLYVIFEYSIVSVGLVSCVFDFYTMRFDLSGIVALFSPHFNGAYPVLQSIADSFFLALAGGVAAVFLSYLLAKQRIGKWNVMLIFSMGISSALLAMGLLYLHIVTGFSVVALFIFGSVLSVVPVAYMFLSPHIDSFDRNVIEAAQIDGASRFDILTKIEIPLLGPFLVSALLQVSMIIFGEFTIAYTMQIQDVFPLVSVTAFSLEASRHIRESNALSGLLIFFVLAASVINYLVTRYVLSRDR